MSLAAFDGSELQLQPSVSESARFGLEVARLTVPRDAAMTRDTIADLTRGTSFDVVIVRYPAIRGETAEAVAVTDYAVIPAGGLTYWAGQLDHVPRPQPRNGIRATRLGVGDTDAVDRLIADIFRGYRNHYYSNPLFDPNAVAAGYAEWARRTALAPDGRSIVLSDGDRHIGLATVDPEGWEIELAGIVTDRQRGGLYPHLLDGVHEQARRAGANRVVISTQTFNLGVQRAWARSGYLPIDAIDTVHLVRRELLLP